MPFPDLELVRTRIEDLTSGPNANVSSTRASPPGHVASGCAAPCHSRARSSTEPEPVYDSRPPTMRSRPNSNRSSGSPPSSGVDHADGVRDPVCR
jgi:hypothetical protein